MEGGSVELSAGVPEEIATARHALEMRRGEWGCGYIDGIVLVFSELVTNAIKHAGVAERILLQSSDGVIKIAVHDTQPGRHRRCARTLTSPAGSDSGSS